MSGANQYWPSELGLDIQTGERTREVTHDLWLFGLINACPYLLAGLV
jgi:hypothetical protein